VEHPAVWQITPKDYMEEVLAPKGNDAAKNQVNHPLHLHCELQLSAV
jgi:hypothetical protein